MALSSNPPKKKVNYIDNVVFAEAMKAHYRKVAEVRKSLEERGIKDPKLRNEELRVPVSNYIGECFYKIANKLAMRPNFSGYSYRDEMVCDALETMIANAHHFNPEAETRGGAPNPFSYFTLVAWRAFVHRINREKKQEYVKYKVTQNQMVLGGGLSVDGDSTKADSRSGIDLDSDYYVKLAEKYDKPPKEKKQGLEKFLEDE